jgi:hypothetical protein
MFGPQVFTAHAPGLFGGGLQQFFGSFGGRQVPVDRNSDYPGYSGFQGMAEFQKVDPQKHQGLTGNSRPLFKQGNEYMLGKQLI